MKIDHFQAEELISDKFRIAGIPPRRV